ncbi:hypothetical protein AB0H63_03115 [Micromonospora echinospora]|uniref:YqeB family protein n=1 Tax=Micromonospora echinospora TaxID=1877 RepID=UPI0033E537FF
MPGQAVPAGPNPGSPVVVSGGVGELALFWGGFPALGAGAGWLLATFVDRLAGWSWVPAQDLLELVASLPEPQVTVGALAVGTLAGLVIAGIGTWERLVVTVAPDRVTLRQKGEEQEWSRATVRAVFRDRRQLVLLGPADEELFRESCDLSDRRLRGAFLAHGYPWLAEDPHRDSYRRWVPGLPDLPPGADALLRARQDALKHDRRDDARELRGELAALGLVVRDDSKRQYFRLTRAG